MTETGRALVVEGGGMKAAYANGVLTAFERAGHHSFDAVYGTSAGGALAAWFGARQSEYAEATWDYAADRRILSYRRALLRGGPLLDHDALLEIVYERERPIDQDAIRRSAFPIVVTAVDVDSGETAYHDLRKGPIIPWLKATGRLPIASGPPVEIDGRRFLDGGINDPVPIQRAIADGHRDITLILNNPSGLLRPEPALLARVTARRYPALRDGLLRHHEIKRAGYEAAAAPPDGVTVRVVRPEAATGIHRLSRDLAGLRRVIAAGRADGERHLRNGAAHAA